MHDDFLSFSSYELYVQLAIPKSDSNPIVIYSKKEESFERKQEEKGDLNPKQQPNASLSPIHVEEERIHVIRRRRRHTTNGGLGRLKRSATQSIQRGRSFLHQTFRRSSTVVP